MQIFLNPDTATTIDVAVSRHGQMVGEFSRQTLEEIRQRYPNAQLGTADDVQKIRDNKMKSEPVEITKADYDAAMDVLPPHDLSADVRGASFKSSEPLSGSLTAIYAYDRQKDIYWTFNDSMTLRHDAIMKRVQR